MPLSMCRSAALAAACLVALLFVAVPLLDASPCDPEILERAHNGDHNAQSFVAFHYASKDNRDRDLRKARYWYEQVINNRNADAKIVAHANLLLGIMYNHGLGARQDYRKAMDCFQAAAEHEYSVAYISIGNLYAQGLGVPKNYEKARFWWTRAAEKGNPKAYGLLRGLDRELLRTSSVLN